MKLKSDNIQEALESCGVTSDFLAEELKDRIDGGYNVDTVFEIVDLKGIDYNEFKKKMKKYGVTYDFLAKELKKRIISDHEIDSVIKVINFGKEEYSNLENALDNIKNVIRHKIDDSGGDLTTFRYTGDWYALWLFTGNNTRYCISNYNSKYIYNNKGITNMEYLPKIIDCVIFVTCSIILISCIVKR